MRVLDSKRFEAQARLLRLIVPLVVALTVGAGNSWGAGLWTGISDGASNFRTARWATWDTYEQMKVLAGDFNGDRRTDVMKFDVPSSGTRNSGLWVGLSGGTRFNATEWARWDTNRQIKVLAGDFNGDGKTDVMKFDVPASGSAQGGLWVGVSDGVAAFNTSRWATWTTNQQMKVLAGDFNGDGKTDVMKFDVPSSGTGTLGLWVGLSDGTKFSTAQWAQWNTSQHMKVLAGDFNGDGKTDVMKFDVPSSGTGTLGLWVGLSDGTRFNSAQWAQWNTSQHMKVLVGDFNGDGKADVMKFDVPSSGTGTLGLWVGLSDGTRFNTTEWAKWDTNQQMMVLVGDFNGDGKADVMKFDVPTSGVRTLGLWVGLSDGSKFNTSRWTTWDTYTRMMVLSGNFNGDRKDGRPIDDVMKFDVPAPASAEARCKARGGVWMDVINHCSMAAATAYGIAMTALNPLVTVYKGYFAVVGGGATMRNLPDYVVQRLKGHFSEILLRRVEYGASHHTSSDDTAMTDCDKIYFPSGRGYVDNLKDGRTFDKDAAGRFVYEGDIRLLLHELTHVQQCIDWGGREDYAVAWFSQLHDTTLEELITNPRNVSNRRIHDAMPMEGHADANADRIFAQL